MIRKAKPTEIIQLIGITKACASKMIANGIYQWNEHYPTLDAFKKDLEREELYVLISEEKVIGSVTISSEKDEEYNDVSWLTNDTVHYYIHRLNVAPEFQHKGYAKELMDFAEDFASKHNAVSIRLDTFSQNKRNQKFYKARGYKQLESIFFPKQSEHPFYCYELLLS